MCNNFKHETMGNQQLLNEVWKDISNYEGCYQVSNYGRIKSVKRIVKSPRGVRTVNERILKLSIDKYGYKTLVLHKEGHKNDKHFTVHRIVALHFVNNPNNYPCVNHKDENKINNFYENLEWCTVDYNNKYNQRQEKINIKLRKELVERFEAKLESDGIGKAEFMRDAIIDYLGDTKAGE